MKEKLTNTRFLCKYSNSFLKSDNQLYLDDMCFHMHMIIDFMIKQKKLKFVVHGDRKNQSEILSRIEKMIDNFSYAYPAFTSKNDPVTFDDDYPNPFKK